MFFYVGKGGRSRTNSHESEARRGCGCLKCVTVRSVWAAGFDVTARVVFETYDERAALAREADEIAAIGLKNLTNRQAGSPSASNDNSIAFLFNDQAKKDARTVATRYNLNGVSAAIRFALREVAREIDQAANSTPKTTPEENAERGVNSDKPRPNE